MHGDWIAAIASIIAAIVGGAVTYFFERYRAARRILRFVIRPPELISQGLRRHGTFLEIKIGDTIVRDLNAATVSVRNDGNALLENVTFDLILPGEHPLSLVDRVSENEKLRDAISVKFEPNAPVLDRRFAIALPFFNIGENFDLKIFFDNAPISPRIECRLQGVATRIDTPEDIRAREKLQQRVILGIMGMTIAVTGLALAFTTFERLNRPSQELQKQLPDAQTPTENK